MKKLNLEKRKTIQPFLEKNVYEKRKAISPLIATILLVVVAVAIIGIVLSWGKGFTTDSLSQTQSVADFKINDATNFVFKPEYRGSNLTFTYSPPSNLKDKSITIDRYTLSGSNEIYTLDTPIVLRDGLNSLPDLNLDMFTIVDRQIDIILISTNNDYITLRKTNYLEYAGCPSCETCEVCPGPVVPLDLPYVYYPPGQTNTVLYIHTTDRSGTTNWSTAVSYCDDLDSLGYDDWYLLSATQMMAIWESCPDQTKTNTCMNNNIQNKITGWSNIVSSFYWTKTEYSSSNAYRFAVHTGAFSNIGKSDSFDVRCVRDH